MPELEGEQPEHSSSSLSRGSQKEDGRQSKSSDAK